MSSTVHGAQHQPDNATREQGLDPAHDAVDDRHDPDPAQRLFHRGARGVVFVAEREGGAQLHEHGPGGGEDVHGAVHEERPVQREAPDVGRVVQVGRGAGGGADGPVERRPVRRDVVVWDFGRGGGHCRCMRDGWRGVPGFRVK